MTGERADQVPFAAHIELLQCCLTQRQGAVERIQEVLNAQSRPAALLHDAVMLSRQIEDCIYGAAATTPQQLQLRGQLRAAHRASGFRPSAIPSMHNDVVDPGQMATRAFQLWQQTRWPGRNGRLRYAQTLFNLYVLQCLELLVMRCWDAGPEPAGTRLGAVQALLDRLWQGSPPDQPVLVRDARWLIPLAQSPANEELAPYFEVAARPATGLAAADCIEIHRAGVMLAGGHLRSQLRHYFLAQGETLADRKLILRSRRTNALDFAMLIQSLVVLLRAYEAAIGAHDAPGRRDLASAICQGISADPELFVNRLELLAAYSMIEYLCVAPDAAGGPEYTALGMRHAGLVRDYAALMPRLAGHLHADCAQFRPVTGASSPYGAIYGFSNNLLEHMAAKTLQADAVTGFSLEDIFRDGPATQLAWLAGLRKLPHISQQVQQLYEYPQDFAVEVFERLERALRAATVPDAATGKVRTGRLFISPVAQAPGAGSHALPLPAGLVMSSDMQRVGAGRAQAMDQQALLHDRHEGMYLVSYRTEGGWTGISKDLLTTLLAMGRDVAITGLPPAAAAVLRKVCPGLTAG